MLDRRRHAPLARPRLARLELGQQGVSQVYRGRGRRTHSSIFDVDHADSRTSGRFRWMLSTCLAAMVGAVAIGIVAFGSLDGSEAGIDSVLTRMTTSANAPATSGVSRATEGPRWAVPRSERGTPAAGSPSVKLVIHEQIQVRRNGRPYNQIRPYMKIVTRLQPVSPRNLDVIPSFNPIALYGVQVADQDSAAAGQRNNFRFQVLDLIGGNVPNEDGIELDANEIAEAVALFEAEENLVSAASGTGGGTQSFARPLGEQTPPNTTILVRQRPAQAPATETLERQVMRVHTMQRGETLERALRAAGGEPLQVRQMISAMRTVMPESQVTPGLQLHLTMVPSLSRPGDEPARFSLFAEGGEHRVSVTRNASGEFEASAKPFTNAIVRAAMQENDTTQGASIYHSLYYAALSMGVPPTIIMQKLRVHAYDTDFRRQVNSGDFAEFFFDMKEDTGSGEPNYGDLLYTAMATGGEIYRYWRFRTPDNQIDYYDENGNNSKKFLMRRPVRGENVRLASGFGMRLHPILNFLRPHNGIDWAAPIGTPILAAGNGVVEEARHRGEFGNHIRIRHSNGYQSTYSHMSRYAPRLQEGSNVRQGEVIGFVGNTGLSKGPHLHFEIHANQRPVDPLSIQVPRERQLTGRLLAEFQKERARIDELMRRHPVSTERK